MNRPYLIELKVNVDDRGSLYEAFHHYELPEECQPFRGQVYIVRSPAKGTIRGFHRHQVLWDFFSVIQGRAKVVLVPTRPGEISYPNIQTFVLCAEKPSLLVVPPTWFHGWESLVDGTVLLSIGSELYNAKHPDEERIPFDSFGDVWGINPR